MLQFTKEFKLIGSSRLDELRGQGSRCERRLNQWSAPTRNRRHCFPSCLRNRNRKRPCPAGFRRRLGAWVPPLVGAWAGWRHHHLIRRLCPWACEQWTLVRLALRTQMVGSFWHRYMVESNLNEKVVNSTRLGILAADYLSLCLVTTTLDKSSACLFSFL